MIPDRDNLRNQSPPFDPEQDTQSEGDGQVNWTKVFLWALLAGFLIGASVIASHLRFGWRS